MRHPTNNLVPTTLHVMVVVLGVLRSVWRLQDTEVGHTSGWKSKHDRHWLPDTFMIGLTHGRGSLNTHFNRQKQYRIGLLHLILDMYWSFPGRILLFIICIHYYSFIHSFICLFVCLFHLFVPRKSCRKFIHTMIFGYLA